MNRKLFGHPDSGHAFKVRLCLCVAGIEHDHELEETLADGRDWMIGSTTPTIADFSLCGYLVFADEAGVAVPPGVKAWLARVSSLDSWQHPYHLLGPDQAG